MNIITIGGSHGTIQVDRDTEAIISIDPGEYSDIVKIDFKEYKQYYHTDIIPAHLDILDVGYWYGKEETYEPPAYQWREEYRRL